MENYVQNAYQRMLDELLNVPEARNLSVKNPSCVGDVVRKMISSLKQHFQLHPFKDKNEEIRFFKYEKPNFQAEYIYAVELYLIESNRPFAEPEVIENYYNQELQAIKRFFDQRRYLYQYFQLDGAELDHLYFRRNSEDPDIIMDSSWDNDPEFSTTAGFLFAKFIALERLQNYLINLVYSPGVKTNHQTGPGFSWTGDKINLIELAYGLYDAAQISDGETSIAEIIAWLEQSFNVRLPRYFQMFSEIRSRKSVSKSRFLDHMAKVVNLHIEQGDSFRPQKPKPVSGSKSTIKA